MAIIITRHTYFYVDTYEISEDHTKVRVVFITNSGLEAPQKLHHYETTELIAAARDYLKEQSINILVGSGVLTYFGPIYGEKPKGASLSVEFLLDRK